LKEEGQRRTNCNSSRQKGQERDANQEQHLQLSTWGNRGVSSSESSSLILLSGLLRTPLNCRISLSSSSDIPLGCAAPTDGTAASLMRIPPERRLVLTRPVCVCAQGISCANIACTSVPVCLRVQSDRERECPKERRKGPSQ